MSEGFPLLTTKKMAWKTMVTELLWFLRGDTNIKFLVENGCHIWDGDAYKNYLKNHKDKLIGCTIVLSNGVSAEIIAQHNVNRNVLITDKGRINIEGDDTIKILNDTLTQEEFINKIKTDDEFAKRWGELGPIYGKQWRQWGGLQDLTDDDKPIYLDQIANLINDLKTNPDSRRLMVSAWNVGELDQMVLPPCHYGFQVYTRELSVVERMEYYGKHFMKETDSKTFDELSQIDYDKLNIPTRAISLMWNQRSCDFPLGIPMNIASYGLLLEIIAKIVNMVPDELIGNFGDCHIYLNQIEGVKEQIGRDYTQEEIQEHLQQSGMDALTEEARMEYVSKLPKRTREPMELPTLKLPKTDAFWNGFDVSLFGHLDPTDFKIENYQSHPKIFFPLSN